MAIDLKSFARGEIEQSRDLFLKDIAALSDEALKNSPGGVARAPYSIMLEIVIINKRFAKRMRGEDPGPFDSKAWGTVPEDFQNRETATQQFKETMDDVLAAFEAVPENELDREIPTQTGKTTPFELAMFCASHAGYHDGQLNYLQALNGDAEVHWN